MDTAATSPGEGAGRLTAGLERDLERDAGLVEHAFPELAAGAPASGAAAPATGALSLAAGALGELRGRQGDFLGRRARLLQDRARQGRVRHLRMPPLRLHAIALGDDREWHVLPGLAGAPTGTEPRDVAVDLASLALDLAMAGRPALAERLLSSFAGESDDFELYGVIDFYERQQALARAAELARRGTKPSPSEATTEARRWLLLGLASDRRPVLPPTLVAVGGLVASGKSTVAERLAARLGAPRLEADRARAFLVREDRSRNLAPGIEDDVYDELLRRAGIVLASGRSAVLAACFPRRSQRTRARRLADERAWPFVFVECRVDAETAHARLAARDAEAARSGWKQLYDDLAGEWETADELSASQHLVLDCTRPLLESEQRLEAWLSLAPKEHHLP